MTTSDKDKVLTAYEQVKQAVDELKTEYSQAKAAIAKIEANMAALPKMRAPFEDLKQGILELIDAAGQRYVSEDIAPALISFATGGMSGSAGRQEDYGKPLTLEMLEGAVDGSKAAASRAQLVQPQKHQFNDMALYAVCADSLKGVLSKVLETITPKDFGYDTIHPDKVGPTRAEMRRQLAEWESQRDKLKARQDEIRSQLGKLGVSVA